MPDQNPVVDPVKVVDHFFRHESGRIISHLARKYGASSLNLVEDAVQEAMIKAMQVWAFQGVPDNPSAWMMTVARNNLLDVLRRRSRLTFEVESKERYDEVIPEDSYEEFKDDQLRMMFVCCNPALNERSQVILTLKILCGFGIREISKALLIQESAAAKAYTRARNKLQEMNMEFEVPSGRELKQRLNIILKIIYLMFNEGYSSSTGEDLIKKDTCYEAMRLCKMLVDNPSIQDSRSLALLSLMCFQAARFDSRIDLKGELVTLEHQDRGLWDRELIDQGNQFLKKSDDQNISEYHIEASIAGLHANARNYENTNWKVILSLYNLYMKISDSAIVALNRVVAYQKVHGAIKALEEISKLEKRTGIQEYYLYHAIHAELLIEGQQIDLAREALEKAIALTKNKAEKNHLNKKLEYLKKV